MIVVTLRLALFFVFNRFVLIKQWSNVGNSVRPPQFRTLLLLWRGVEVAQLGRFVITCFYILISLDSLSLVNLLTLS